MRIVTTQEMQAIDQTAGEKFKIAGYLLMEEAGRQLANKALTLLPAGRKNRVVVLAGPGKNGGDGLVCARYLAEAGLPADILFFPGAHVTTETQQNLDVAAAKASSLDKVSGPLTTGQLDRLRQADLLIDALLGIGLNGPVREPLSSAISAMNASGTPVLAADIPSGLDADTGVPGPASVRAQWTLTFGAPKAGLLQPAAAENVGRLQVAPIGLPAELLQAEKPLEAFITCAEAAAWLPQRPALAHKTTSGKVLIIGGSQQFHGAPLLAAAGAVRAGAGWVALAYPRSIDAVVRAHTLESLCWPMPETAGALGPKSVGKLLKLAADFDAVVLGPGLGRAPQTLQAVRIFLRGLTGPKVVVLDADALRALPPKREKVRAGSPAWILTPHEGEAADLLHSPVPAVAGERWAAARTLAGKYRAMVVLKGRFTAVAQPEGPVQVLGTGSQALAIAGSGDVLAGVIAALAAQGVAVPQAAALGGILHGLAGDLATPDPWGLGARAREVADKIPQAIAELRRMRAA